MLLVIATPKYAPEVNLSKVTLLDSNEAKSAMYLIKEYTEENNFAESLFADISVLVADRSGAALTNGGYVFALLDQHGKRIAAGRREMPPLPILGLTVTSSNLRIPIARGTKAVELKVGFLPPSAGSARHYSSIIWACVPAFPKSVTLFVNRCRMKVAGARRRIISSFPHRISDHPLSCGVRVLRLKSRARLCSPTLNARLTSLKLLRS